MRIRIEFKLEDCWIGVFWKRTPLRLVCHCGDYMDTHGLSIEHIPTALAQPIEQIDIWICLLPCLPIHITYDRYPTTL